MSIPFVLSDQPTAGDRGFEFGRLMRPEISETAHAYARMFAAVGWSAEQVASQGRIVGEWLSAHCPDILEEIEGIARGSGLATDLILALNARTELLAGTAPRECSAIAAGPTVTRDGSTILAQNWDWHPDLRGARVVWRIAPRNRSDWLCTLTEAGIVAKIGLNSTGFGCTTNILGNTVDGGVGGLPVHVAERLMLESCDSIESALSLLRRHTYTASNCFNLGEADAETGAVISVEVSPGGVRAVAAPATGWCVHTNHFLCTPGRGRDYYETDWPDSWERLEELSNAAQVRHGVTVEDVASMLSSHATRPISVCCHDEDNPEHMLRQGTLASVIMDLTRRRMIVSDGQPCGAPYLAVPSDNGAGPIGRGRLGPVEVQCAAVDGG